MGRRGGRRKMTDAEAEEAIHKELVESGERDRLREKLKKQLEETGWREQVRTGSLEKRHEN